MQFISELLVAGLVLGILDFVWLGFVAKKIYYEEMGNILLKKPRMAPALLFYVLYTIGVVVFVVSPAVLQNSWVYAVGYGGLFGLVAYATYDLTNLATLKYFSRKIVLIDLIWGAGMTAIVSLTTYVIITTFFS